MSWARRATAGLLLLAAGGAALAGPLEGRWALVEQRYGGGAANLVDSGSPKLQLEFVREGGELVGRLRAGGESVRPWPAWRAEGAEPEVVERSVGADERSARTRYRVAGRDDGVVLEVVESYRVEDGFLVGTVDVVFVEDGKPGGSYRLHRRFERVP